VERFLFPGVVPISNRLQQIETRALVLIVLHAGDLVLHARMLAVTDPLQIRQLLDSLLLLVVALVMGQVAEMSLQLKRSLFLVLDKKARPLEPTHLLLAPKAQRTAYHLQAQESISLNICVNSRDHKPTGLANGIDLCATKCSRPLRNMVWIWHLPPTMI
jgi:hypothetical protein